MTLYNLIEQMTNHIPSHSPGKQLNMKMTFLMIFFLLFFFGGGGGDEARGPFFKPYVTRFLLEDKNTF